MSTVSSRQSTRRLFCDEYYPKLSKLAKEANVTEACVLIWVRGHGSTPPPFADQVEELRKLRAPRARPISDEQKEAIRKARTHHRQKRCTISIRQMKQEAHTVKEKPLDVPRPKIRKDCESSERPCPWAGCRYNLLLDVNRNGSLHIATRDGLEFMQESCVLDVAERGGQTLEQIAQFLCVSRERVRQLSDSALARFSSIAQGLR